MVNVERLQLGLGNKTAWLGLEKRLCLICNNSVNKSVCDDCTKTTERLGQTTLTFGFIWDTDSSILDESPVFV